MARRKNMDMIDRAIAKSQKERRATKTYKEKTMVYNTVGYKGYTIKQRIDVKSHCAEISKKGEFLKMVAGSIYLNGTDGAIQKAKNYIDLDIPRL